MARKVKSKAKAKGKSKAKSKPKGKAKPKAKAKISYMGNGYHNVTTYLTVHDGAGAVEFYKQVFGAKERPGRMSDPNGKIMHTEIQIGDSRIMLADEFPEWGNISAKTLGKTPVGMNVYVKNCDAVVEKAVSLGAKLLMPVADQFYGDRSGRIEDPFGHNWIISTHFENVSLKEMHKRMAAMYSQKQ